MLMQIANICDYMHMQAFKKFCEQPKLVTESNKSFAYKAMKHEIINLFNGHIYIYILSPKENMKETYLELPRIINQKI